MINRREFGRLYAERFGVTYKESDVVARRVFELLGSLLYEEKEDVTITGFGSFKHKTAKAKQVRHPASGKIITIPEKEFVKFIPSEQLVKKETVEEK